MPLLHDWCVLSNGIYSHDGSASLVQISNRIQNHTTQGLIIHVTSTCISSKASQSSPLSPPSPAPRKPPSLTTAVATRGARPIAPPQSTPVVTPASTACSTQRRYRSVSSAPDRARARVLPAEHATGSRLTRTCVEIRCRRGVLPLL